VSLIIIGEKLNGAIPSVKQIIDDRDEAAIRALARVQKEAGADYLDVCAGTCPERETAVLRWMLEIIQDEVDTPICIDSPDPDVLTAILPEIKRAGIVNSVSGEGCKCGIIYPLIADSEWKVIALTCDDRGVPGDAETRVGIGSFLIEEAAKHGIGQNRIFIDPLVLTLSAVNNAMIDFMEAVRRLRALYPSVHFTSGLSNISYGMPRRKLINRNFLAYALMAGMDSAIVDPTDKEIYATILAAEVLLGKDKHCRAYNTAYRKGRI